MSNGALLDSEEHYEEPLPPHDDDVGYMGAVHANESSATLNGGDVDLPETSAQVPCSLSFF